MIILELKNCNMTLTEKLQKYQDYHQVKMIKMNMSQTKNACLKGKTIWCSIYIQQLSIKHYITKNKLNLEIKINLKKLRKWVAEKIDRNIKKHTILQNDTCFYRWY